MPFRRIIAAAVELVDDEGAEALTLRALAQRLGSSTATLYRHVDSRADLVGHVVDHLFGEIDLDEDSLRDVEWPRACERLAMSFFEVVCRHPNTAPLLIETVPTGPHVMAFRELSLSVLVGAGLAPEVALRFAVSLARFTVGFAMQVPSTDPERRSADAQAGERIRRADPSRYPLTRQIAAAIPVALEEEFRAGLDLLIRGMRDYARETAELPEGAP